MDSMSLSAGLVLLVLTRMILGACVSIVEQSTASRSIIGYLDGMLDMLIGSNLFS